MATRNRGVLRTAIRLAVAQGVTYDMSGDGMPDNLYPWPTVAVKMRLLGTDAADAPAGLGVQQVELNMLDVNLNSVTLLVDTPGAAAGSDITDPVTSNTLWLRCNGMRATAGGATAIVSGMVGTLELEDSVSNDKLARMNANGSRWNGCIYTIPSDEDIQLFGWSLAINDPGNNNTDVIGQFVSRRNGEGVWNGEVTSDIINASRLDQSFSLSGFEFAAGDDLAVRVRGVAATASDVFGRLQLNRQQRGIGAL